MNDQYVERVIDLTDPARNRIHNMTLDEARARLASRNPDAVRAIDGSFALVARDGRRVVLARSLDRPLRYFLAKQAAGPALVVADRIDAIHAFLRSEGLDGQFHPSYTRMVPAHYVVEIELRRLPGPRRRRTRDTSRPSATPCRRIRPRSGRATSPHSRTRSPSGCAPFPSASRSASASPAGSTAARSFSRRTTCCGASGGNLGRLKAFTLSIGGGAGPRAGAAPFSRRSTSGSSSRRSRRTPAPLDPFEAVRVVEDYKPLDVESATMALALCRGIRERYPEWRFLLDGDGGDENLKDYPIEENPELTIRSVVNNPLLYQEGWGVGKMKHSLTYSGRPEPLVQPHVRAAAALRLRGLQPLHPAGGRGRRGGHPVRGADRRRHGEALRAQGRDRPAGRRGRDGRRDAGLPEAPIPARGARGRGGPPARVRRVATTASTSCPSTPDRALSSAYPTADRDRDRWILERRARAPRARPRARPTPPSSRTRLAESGEVVPVATIFLTNRECPWRCLMCDLWKNTLAGAGAARRDRARRSARALAALPPARQRQALQRRELLRRAGDPARGGRRDRRCSLRALRARHRRVASRARGRALPASARPPRRAARGGARAGDDPPRDPSPAQQAHDARRLPARPPAFLRDADIALRAFVLVGLPWLPEAEALDWACRSTHFAFDCGASAVSLIPTRAGNGALDALSASGDFAQPGLAQPRVRAGLRHPARPRPRLRRPLGPRTLQPLCRVLSGARRATARHATCARRSGPRIACAECGGLA